jgi:hypothetical protein
VPPIGRKLPPISSTLADRSARHVRSNHERPQSNPHRRSSLRAVLDVIFDVGLPTGAYYVLRLVGLSQWWALLAATFIAAGRVGWVALRSRQVTLFGAITLLVYGVGSAAACMTADPRLLLASGSVSSALVGGAFLTSLAFDKPLTLTVYQSWKPQQASAWSALYATHPAARSAFRQGARLWGFGMLAAGALRLPVIYLLPLDIAVAVALAPGTIIMAGLTVWSVRVLKSRLATAEFEPVTA